MFVVRKLFILIMLSMCVMSCTDNATGNNKQIQSEFYVPLVYGDKNNYIVSTFNVDFEMSDSFAQSLINKHESFIDGIKKNKVNTIDYKSLDADGNLIQSQSNKLSVKAVKRYKMIEKMRYEFLISIGKFHFLGVQYTVNGKVRPIKRVDFICESQKECYRSSYGHSQVFEYAYRQFLENIKLSNKGSNKDDYLALDDQSGTFPLIGLSNGSSSFFKIKISRANDALVHEYQRILTQLKEKLYFTEGESERFLEDIVLRHENDKAYPLIDWSQEPKLYFTSSLGYIKKISSCLNDYGAFRHDRFSFLIINCGEEFDFQIITFEKEGDQYKFNPLSKEGTQRSAFMFDQYFLTNMKSYLN